MKPLPSKPMRLATLLLIALLCYTPLQNTLHVLNETHAATQDTKAEAGEKNKDSKDSKEKESDESEKEEKAPPARKFYKGRELAQTMHFLGAEWLVRNRRQAEENTRLAMQQLGIKKGMTVCDLGCGNGYYALPMARMVGEKGTVYGVDIQPEMLAMMMQRAKRQEVKNIKPVKGKLWDPMLPPNSQDLILMVDVYHEFSHPELMLKAMHKALKPEGVIVLLEYRMEDESVPIKRLHKMSKKQILKEYTPNNFTLVKEFDKLPWQHMMFFKRSDAPSLNKKKDKGENTK